MLTTTVAATVAGSVGIRTCGKEPVDNTPSSEADRDGDTAAAVEGGVAGDVALSRGPRVDSVGVPALVPSEVLTRRRAGPIATERWGVRLEFAPAVLLTKRVAGADVLSAPSGATNFEATTPDVARPAPTTTAAAPLAAAACETPLRFNHRHIPTPTGVMPSV